MARAARMVMKFNCMRCLVVEMAALGFAGGAQATFFDIEVNNNLWTAQTIARPVGSFAEVGLLNLTPGDADFVKIKLYQGETLTAITTPLGNAQFTVPDTQMTLFDGIGSPLMSNDDAGTGNGSTIQYLVPVTGDYYIGISGYDDPLFAGSSTQAGNYALTLSVVPEPGALLAMGIGLAGLIRLRRRSR